MRRAGRQKGLTLAQNCIAGVHNSAVHSSAVHDSVVHNFAGPSVVVEDIGHCGRGSACHYSPPVYCTCDKFRCVDLHIGAHAHGD